METDKKTAQLDEFDALQRVIAALSPLEDEAKRRIIDAATTFLRIASIPARAQSHQGASVPVSSPSSYNLPSYSENTSLSPKEFLLEKKPKTDVERVACLAYYLANYRGTPHFKTLELSVLNTEAAQPKFANAANASNNAVKMGYLVPSVKGQRQLSAFGEQFVRALPDREAAKEAVQAYRRRPRSKKKSNGDREQDKRSSEI